MKWHGVLLLLLFLDSWVFAANLVENIVPGFDGAGIGNSTNSSVGNCTAPNFFCLPRSDHESEVTILVSKDPTQVTLKPFTPYRLG